MSCPPRTPADRAEKIGRETLYHYFFEKKNWQHDIAIFWISQLDFARRNTLKPLENLKFLGFTHGACLLFFRSLKCEYAYLRIRYTDSGGIGPTVDRYPPRRGTPDRHPIKNSPEINVLCPGGPSLTIWHHSDKV